MMQAKDAMAAFLSALVFPNQESFAVQKLELCLASPDFRRACLEGLLNHCHVTDSKGNVSRPLELAARMGYTSVVSELLALGASPALKSQVQSMICFLAVSHRPLLPCSRLPRQFDAHSCAKRTALIRAKAFEYTRRYKYGFLQVSRTFAQHRYRYTC
jgi:hypothetical protein